METIYFSTDIQYYVMHWKFQDGFRSKNTICNTASFWITSSHRPCSTRRLSTTPGVSSAHWGNKTRKRCHKPRWSHPHAVLPGFPLACFQYRLHYNLNHLQRVQTKLKSISLWLEYFKVFRNFPDVPLTELPHPPLEPILCSCESCQACLMGAQFWFLFLLILLPLPPPHHHLHHGSV